MDVWEYFAQREREFAGLSVAPDPRITEMFAEEAGSNGMRGRIFGTVFLAENAYLAISEKVVVRGNHIHREEYGYFLVVDDAEVWGYERDPSHEPAVHRHIGPDHSRHDNAEPISFKKVVQLAWDDLSEWPPEDD
jgi:hypothetical protein